MLFLWFCRVPVKITCNFFASVDFFQWYLVVLTRVKKCEFELTAILVAAKCLEIFDFFLNDI